MIAVLPDKSVSREGFDLASLQGRKTSVDEHTAVRHCVYHCVLLWFTALHLRFCGGDVSCYQREYEWHTEKHQKARSSQATSYLSQVKTLSFPSWYNVKDTSLPHITSNDTVKSSAGSETKYWYSFLSILMMFYLSS